MAIGDLYVLRVNYHLPDAQVSIGHGYKQSAGVNDKDTLQSAVDFWVANSLTFLRNCLAADVEVDQVRMDQVEPGNELPGFDNLVGLPGTVTGQALPSGSASVLSWVTDAPNSKHNGRMYIAGVSENEVVNGLLTAAQSAMQILLADELQTDLLTSLPQTAVFVPNVISRVLNGAPRVPPVGFEILSGVVRLPLFSQRRRITSRLGTS